MTTSKIEEVDMERGRTKIKRANFTPKTSRAKISCNYIDNSIISSVIKISFIRKS